MFSQGGCALANGAQTFGVRQGDQVTGRLESLTPGRLESPRGQGSLLVRPVVAELFTVTFGNGGSTSPD